MRDWRTRATLRTMRRSSLLIAQLEQSIAARRSLIRERRSRRKNRVASQAAGVRDEPDKKSSTKGLLWTLWESLQDDLLLVVFATAAGIIHGMGVTIQSGQTGLLFSFGRAKRTLKPGFHPLIPFLQKVRRMPTRSRTLDLPFQRVEIEQGLVFHADANLVYRVADIKKAVVQVDKLERGMFQMLGLGVQEVLRRADREQLNQTQVLNKALRENLAQRLEQWGVEVERAGFPSITPSPQTLRVTQLEQITMERRAAMERFIGERTPVKQSLGLVGTRRVPVRRTRSLQRLETHRRRIRRMRASLKKAGWNAPQIKQMGLSMLLRQRLTRRS